MLKKMGVKNNSFMLVLTQPELQGIDPHSPNLTQEQKMRIAMECKINPWYAFREVIRIPTPGGDPIPYVLNRANLATMWCFFNNIKTFLTMPRQIGKTIASLALTMYSLYFLGENINIGMFAKGSKLQVENVRRVKEIRNALPKYLYQDGRAYSSDNMESIEYKLHKNKYITFVASASKKAAEAQGRGESLIWTHWDEFAYYENNDLSYDSASAASDAAGDSARAAGLPATTIITTTAGYTSDGPGKYAYRMRNQALRFEEKYYDCEDIDEVNKLLEASSKNNFMYLEFSYKQLGKDDAWFKDKTSGKDRETIDRDYLNRWIHAAGDSIIPKQMMDKLREHVEEPVSVTIEQSLVLRWYVDQNTLKMPDVASIPYVIACDSSNMVGKDFTTLVMINPSDMAVVMTCRCNQTNIVYMADAIINLLKRFDRSVFVPEQNGPGSTMISIIIERMDKENIADPFKRIYNRFVQDKGDVRHTKSKHDVTLGSVRKMFGFLTDKNSRHFLYSKVLMTGIERNYNRIFDHNIVDEMCGLVLRNGRVDHKISNNDDTLIAYLIGCWFIMFAKHIEQYGMNRHEVVKTGEEGDFQDNEGVAEMRDRVAYLEKKLKSRSLSPMMKMAFETELADIRPALDELDSTTYATKDHISVHQIEAKNDPAKTFNVHNLMGAMKANSGFIM